MILAIIMVFLWGANFPLEKEETIKIGISYPLTGFAASYGNGGLAGVEYAVNEINLAGGIDGKLIELIVEDDQCDPTESVRVANKLINIDMVDVLVGQMCSGAAEAMLPMVQESGTPMILTGTSKPELVIGKDYVFRIYLNDNKIGEQTAKYFYSEKNYENVAIILENNAWGVGIRNVFVDKFSELGGNIVFDEAIESSTQDMRTVLLKLQQANADALFFPVYKENFLKGAKEMIELGIDIPVYTGDSVYTQEVLSSEVSQGKRIIIGKLNLPEEFEQRVKEFSNRETNIITPMGYDAINLFAEVISKTGLNKEQIKNELSKISYEGVTYPLIEFDSEGDLKESQIDVKEIRDKTTVIIYSN